MNFNNNVNEPRNQFKYNQIGGILQQTPVYENSMNPQESNLFGNNFSQSQFNNQSENFNQFYHFDKNENSRINYLQSQKYTQNLPQTYNSQNLLRNSNSDVVNSNIQIERNFNLQADITTENSSKLETDNRHIEGRLGSYIPEGCMPKLQNIVSTLNLKCDLDLREIALRARNAEYNPKRFAAVIMRIREPKTTALIFASGKMVCTGARNEEDSRKASRQYAKIIRKLGFSVKFTEFKIQNIVGSCDVKFPIRLEGLASDHAKFCNYEPEMFPGLIYRMIKPKIVLLIFVSGKIVLTGAKEREDIYKAFEMIYSVLSGYKKKENPHAISTGPVSQS